MENLEDFVLKHNVFLMVQTLRDTRMQFLEKAKHLKVLPFLNLSGKFIN